MARQQSGGGSGFQADTRETPSSTVVGGSGCIVSSAWRCSAPRSLRPNSTERSGAIIIAAGLAGRGAHALETVMLKFLGIVIAIIFIIGLLVVMGVFKLIF